MRTLREIDSIFINCEVNVVQSSREYINASAYSIVSNKMLFSCMAQHHIGLEFHLSLARCRLRGEDADLDRLDMSNVYFQGESRKLKRIENSASGEPKS